MLLSKGHLILIKVMEGEPRQHLEKREIFIPQWETIIQEPTIIIT
jgi:hypothetical protein